MLVAFNSCKLDRDTFFALRLYGIKKEKMQAKMKRTLHPKFKMLFHRATIGQLRATMACHCLIVFSF